MAEDAQRLLDRVQDLRGRIGKPARESLLPEALVDLASKGARSPALLTLAEVAFVCDAILKLPPSD